MASIFLFNEDLCLRVHWQVFFFQFEIFFRGGAVGCISPVFFSFTIDVMCAAENFPAFESPSETGVRFGRRGEIGGIGRGLRDRKRGLGPASRGFPGHERGATRAASGPPCRFGTQHNPQNKTLITFGL